VSVTDGPDASCGAPGVGNGWEVFRRSGTVAELHGLDLPGTAPVARGIWVLEPVAPAVALGSAQRQLVPDAGVSPPVAGSPARVVRSSGGGAVLVDPACCVWIDVVIPRDDPLWHDDVGRSALWLGRCWQAALADLGITAGVHEGPADRHDAARAACFAGMGPGEVVADGRKLVGISQRRTRTGARYQCLAYTALPAVAPLVAALGGVAPVGLADQLVATTGYVTARHPVLVDAVVRAMMTTTPSDGAAERGAGTPTPRPAMRGGDR